MQLSTQVRPISFLKANAAAIVREIGASGDAMVITQNGEAKAVLQDVASYEEMQETLALLKLLALGDREVDDGQVQPIAEAVADLRAELHDEFKR